VDAAYHLTAGQHDEQHRFKPNLELMRQVCECPANWSLEFDEDLADLIKDYANTDTSGSIKNLIKNIAVSTQRVLEIKLPAYKKMGKREIQIIIIIFT
jgi:hypothetical protein